MINYVFFIHHLPSLEEKTMRMIKTMLSEKISRINTNGNDHVN